MADFVVLSTEAIIHVLQNTTIFTSLFCNIGGVN